MKPRKIALQAVKMGWVALLPMVASAMDRSSMGMVSVGGGISMPSYSTALGTNAAGLVENPGLNLQLQGGGDSTFANQLYKAGLAYGNGTFGIAAGGTYNNPAAATGAQYGLAFAIPSLHTAIGVSGFTGLSPSTDSTFNAGLLIMPTSMFTLGFTGVGLTNAGGIEELGAGLGIHFNPTVSLVVDAAFSSALAFLTIEPALKVGNETGSLMVGYGSGSGSTQLVNNEVTVGAALKLGSKINWELYYNKFTTYYTGFAIQF